MNSFVALIMITFFVPGGTDNLPKIDLVYTFDSLEKCEETLDNNEKHLTEQAKKRNDSKPEFKLDYYNKRILVYKGKDKMLYLACKVQLAKD
jgi:hypothetical protein